MAVIARVMVILGVLMGHAGAAGATADCSAPEHRQFDFWVGEWEVTSAGAPAGHNRISREQEGCVLREQWRGASGVTGTSLNYFDRNDGRWHQIWVDRTGAVLELEGGSPGPGEMRLESDPAASGPRQRIHWQRREDGAVVQHWQQSSDGGASWTTAFLGEYRPASAEAPMR